MTVGEELDASEQQQSIGVPFDPLIERSQSAVFASDVEKLTASERSKRIIHPLPRPFRTVRGQQIAVAMAGDLQNIVIDIPFILIEEKVVAKRDHEGISIYVGYIL